MFAFHLELIPRQGILSLSEQFIQLYRAYFEAGAYVGVGVEPVGTAVPACVMSGASLPVAQMEKLTSLNTSMCDGWCPTRIRCDAVVVMTKEMMTSFAILAPTQSISTIGASSKIGRKCTLDAQIHVPRT